MVTQHIHPTSMTFLTTKKSSWHQLSERSSYYQETSELVHNLSNFPDKQKQRLLVSNKIVGYNHNDTFKCQSWFHILVKEIIEHMSPLLPQTHRQQTPPGYTWIPLVPELVDVSSLLSINVYTCR